MGIGMGMGMGTGLGLGLGIVLGIGMSIGSIGTYDVHVAVSVYVTCAQMHEFHT